MATICSLLYLWKATREIRVESTRKWKEGQARESRDSDEGIMDN
jgi:hypothetical protein